MRLRVDKITEEASTCTFSEPAEQVNVRIDAGAVRDFRLARPLDVEATYYRAGEELIFTGQVSTQLEGTCARCLESFPLAIDLPVRFVLTREDSESDDRELQADDLALSFYRGEEIELAPLFGEQVILALPTRPLCREDCRGLCPRCGVDLNRETCACSPAEGDPRLEILRGLKVRSAS